MCVCVAIGDSLSLLQEFYHVFSQLNTDQQESTHLEAAISILDTMEGVLAIAETLSCVMVCSECIQLVTEDAVNKKRCGHEERQQEWTDVKLQYLLQLRHSIVTCVCIRMMRDELESSESHDKVPTLLTAAVSGYLCCEEGWYHYHDSQLLSSSSLISDQYTHTTLTMECRSCSKYCSFTSVHSCCRSSWPHLFLLSCILCE